MADEKTFQAPPLPPRGEIVTQEALYQSQLSLYSNSLAFGGLRNPSMIWATMVYNHPQAMLLYRELEDKDEDVADALETLRLKVLERDHDVSPGDESQLALDVAQFVKDQLANVEDFHSVLDCVLDAPGYGFTVQEQVFDTSAGQASLVGINDCPQELFLFGSRYEPQIGPLQFLKQPWASSGDLVPEEKFLVFTYRKRGRNRMGRPLLKSVFWPSWFKRNLERLWLKFAEKGPGTAVVYYNDADNVEERQQAASIAQAIVDGVAIAVPQNLKFETELLKIARSQDPATYEKFFEAMQYSIARKILGETLTSFGNEGGHGSNAQGQTHTETLDTRVAELARSVASVINSQLVRRLVLWNYGPDAPMPKWSFNVGEEENLKDRLVVDMGVQKMGKQITAGYVSNRYDVPLVKGEDPALPLVPSASAAAPANLGAPDDGDTFAEDAKEQHEFDELVEQLKTGADPLLAHRTRQVAASAQPVEVSE